MYKPRRLLRPPRARLASLLPGFDGGVTSRLLHVTHPHAPYCQCSTLLPILATSDSTNS